MKNLKIYLLTLFCVTQLQLRAEVVLPRVIGSDMVLQRGKPLPIWGTATAGEQVSVRFGKQTKTATADAAGNWKVILDPLVASEKPEVMVIQGTNSIILKNILVGEVWLCSGQSNMAYEMRKNSKVTKPDSLDKNSPVDELNRPSNPNIRIFWTNQKNLKTTGNYLARWNMAQDSALRSFSAAGYFFAKKLNEELHVPVGMICSAISGSAIEPWTPEDAYTSINYFKSYGISAKPTGKFYHTMIEPLAPFAISGFLWYQGEANMQEGVTYTYKMEALINSWRSLWADKSLPFYYVQIVPFMYSTLSPTVTIPTDKLPEFWEAQALALNIPNTGMIETTDLNDNVKNLHPHFKWEIGRRLAILALAKTYGKKIVYSGPMYKQMKVSGNKIELTFDNTGSGLISKNGKPLDWFTIAGADGKFVSADAVISGNKVIVSSSLVSAPTAVRFAWAETAQPNLFNKEGLPAAPFRTDNPLKFNNN
jgi:sialate O-acetylesterase